MKTSRTISSSLETKITGLEKKIRAMKTKMAELRRTLPAQEVSDYIFKDRSGKNVTLSESFLDKQELILIQNMGKACVYCTLWADGFNGIIHHLENRAAFVVVSSDDVKTQREFADSRGWKFRMLSSKENTFKKDLGFEPHPGDFDPGVSIFIKDKNGKIFHRTSTNFGPGDNYCNLWDLLDLLPTDKAWGPKYSYSKK